MLRHFFRESRGNVAIIFAIAVVPLIGGMGVAVDYSRAATARTALQNTADAVALWLAKENISDSAQASMRAQQLFGEMYESPFARDATVTASITETGGEYRITVSATAKVDMNLVPVLGIKEAPISTHAEVVWSSRRLELALALDTTGSMASGNKLTELQTAAKGLIEDFKNTAKKEDDIKVAIIPFNTHVNVGKGHVKAPWLTWDEWEKNNQNSNRNTWNGCVMDRDQDHDIRDTNPSNAGARFPVDQAGKCPVELTPLTSQWGTLVSRINSLNADGYTNVTIGLAWAWHALSPQVPLAEGSSSKDVEKVIVLLTDGDNTKNRWTSDVAAIDERTKKACDNVKAAGITLYTIRVIDGNTKLLKGCASDSSKFFNVKNAAELTLVFKQIGKNLASIRLAK